MHNTDSLIIGPGAIGALACAHAQASSNCFVPAHRENLELSQSLQIGNDQIELNWQLAKQPTNTTLIWVCCKASAAYQATKPLLENYPSAYAIMLHNGMGPQQALSEEFPNRVIWGATTCGAMRKDRNTIIQTAPGKTMLGLPIHAGLPDEVKTLILPAGNNGPNVLGIEFTGTIEQTLWNKVLVNAAINPITAIHQVTNGELLLQRFRSDITGICRETCSIMQENGIKAPADPVAFVLQVAHATANNRSSMAEDIRQNRATEIDYINGFLITQAKKLGISTPHLQRWYNAVAEKSEC